MGTAMLSSRTGSFSLQQLFVSFQLLKVIFLINSLNIHLSQNMNAKHNSSY